MARITSEERVKRKADIEANAKLAVEKTIEEARIRAREIVASDPLFSTRRALGIHFNPRLVTSLIVAKITAPEQLLFLSHNDSIRLKKCLTPVQQRAVKKYQRRFLPAVTPTTPLQSPTSDSAATGIARRQLRGSDVELHVEKVRFGLSHTGRYQALIEKKDGTSLLIMN